MKTLGTIVILNLELVLLSHLIRVRFSFRRFLFSTLKDSIFYTKAEEIDSDEESELTGNKEWTDENSNKKVIQSKKIPYDSDNFYIDLESWRYILKFYFHQLAKI